MKFLGLPPSVSKRRQTTRIPSSSRSAGFPPETKGRTPIATKKRKPANNLSRRQGCQKGFRKQQQQRVFQRTVSVCFSILFLRRSFVKGRPSALTSHGPRGETAGSADRASHTGSFSTALHRRQVMVARQLRLEREKTKKKSLYRFVPVHLQNLQRK